MIAPIPLWRDRDDLQPVPTADEDPARPMSTRVDVAVVGGGIVGLAAALTVATAGASVVLLDAGALGDGASSAGSGLIGWAHGNVDRIAGGPGVGADLRAAVTSAGTALTRRITKSAWEVDLVAPSGAILAGTEHAPSLAGVHPRKLIEAMAADLRGAGAGIGIREPMRSIARHTGGYQLLTNRRKITAATVVLAAGGAVGPRPLGEIRRRLVERTALAAATSPLPPGYVAELIPPTITISRPGRVPWMAHSTPDHRVVLWHADPAPHGRGEAAARALAIATVPALADVAFTHVWHDRHSVTADEVPRIGRIDGMWYAVGGGDLALGAVVGDHVGGLVSGSRPRSPFAEIAHRAPRFDRVRRLTRR
jgi:glycine/D-amino acid oxidase-like deaminating enzyme